MNTEKNPQVTTKRIPYTRPPDDMNVNYVVAGNMMKIKGCTKTPIINSVRISATQYMNRTTGEIKDYKQSTPKSSRNLNRQFESLAYLIASNFKGNHTEVHIILTYSNGEKDRDIVGRDLKAFIKRLKYRYRSEYATLEYIAIYEQHDSGAWHVHLLLKAANTLFIPFDELRIIWGHGQVHIKKNHICDRNPYYFSVFTEQVAVMDKDGNRMNRTHGKKARRLVHYPHGKKLYSKSTGIAKPIQGSVVYKDLSEWINSLGIQPTYKDKRQILLKEEDIEMVINTVYTESYYLE